MAEVLEEYGVAPIFREDRARNTWGNAHYSAELLDGLGIRRVALVTHAHHMPRAVWSFRQAGVEVIPAPTGAFVPDDRTFGPGSLRPQARALYASWLAMHEYLGLAWYRLRPPNPGPRGQQPRGNNPGQQPRGSDQANRLIYYVIVVNLGA